MVIPGDSACNLAAAIEEIRADSEIPADFILKFNPKPEHLEHEHFRDVKQSIIEAAANCNCKLIVSMILHKIASKGEDDARRKEINRVLYHFNCYMNWPENKDHGIVLLDRFEDKQIDNHVREKMTIGITGLPYTPHHKLDRVLGCHYSAIGQSHFCTLVDIVIGTLRYAINIHSKNKTIQMDTAKTILGLLKPLFIEEGISDKIHEISLTFSPKSIRVPSYREKYENLKQFFIDCGIKPAQIITDTPMY